MGHFKGSLRLPEDEPGRGVHVEIDLDNEQLTIRTEGGMEIGTWPLSEVGVHAEDDGFHLRMEGEYVVLQTEDDGRFALALGLAAGSPRLRRLMGAALRSDA